MDTRPHVIARGRSLISKRKSHDAIMQSTRKQQQRKHDAIIHLSNFIWPSHHYLSRRGFSSFQKLICVPDSPHLLLSDTWRLPNLIPNHSTLTKSKSHQPVTPEICPQVCTSLNEHEMVWFPLAGNEDLGIENTNIRTAAGVSLDDTQKTIVGSVLDVRPYLLTHGSVTN